MEAEVRKVIRSGNMLIITLPMSFVRKAGITRGDEIIVSHEDSILMVMPCPSKILKEIESDGVRGQRAGLQTM